MKKIYLITLLFLFAFSQSAFTQGEFSSVAVGPNDWNSAASWNLDSGSDGDGIPDANDNVFILTGHSISLTGSETVNNLTLTGTASVIVGGGFTLTIDGIVDCGATGVISGAGTLDIASTGTLKVGSTNGAGAVATNVTANTLTLNAGSTVEFNGAGAQFAASRTFSNLAINNSNGVTLTGDLTVNSQLFLNSGLVSLNVNTINISDLATVRRSAGSIDGTPTYAGHADFLYTNAAPITSHPELPATVDVVRNLTMNGAGGITFENPVHVYGTLYLTNGIINTTTTNFLYLGPNVGGAFLGAVSNATGDGNGGSYVSGPVQRIYENASMTSLKIYPLGSNNKYRPIMINISHNDVTPTVYEASITEPNDLWNLATTNVSTVSQARRYELREISGSNTINQRQVTIWWNDDDGVTDYTTLAAGKLNYDQPNPQWSDLGNGDISSIAPHSTGGGNLGWVYAFVNAEAVYYYALVSTDPINTLPVSLLSFAGQKVGNSNILRWSTASESNNSGFEIQRSADGENYVAIGFVNSKAIGGNSSGVLTYNFTDNNANGQKYYYRLRQVDFDNKSKLSNIVWVKGETPFITAIDGIFPNPASSAVNVIIASTEKEYVTLVISDMAGRVMSQKQVSIEKGSNTISMEINQLTKGTYMVRLVCENGCNDATKFMKL